MIDFGKQAKVTVAAGVLFLAAVAPASLSLAQTAGGAATSQAIPAMPEEPGAPGAPSAPPSGSGQMEMEGPGAGTGTPGAAMDGPGAATSGPGTTPGRGPGHGPQPPDSVHVGGPGSPTALPEQVDGGSVPTLYAPLGTHLQQTLDVGLPPVAFDVRIAGQKSATHVGVGGPPQPSAEAIEAGRLFLEGLETNDQAKIKDAKALLQRLIPLENFGGEYTALEWFADYMLADEKARPKFLEDPHNEMFFHYYADGEWAGLKEFLARKYNLREFGDEYSKEGRRRKGDLEHTMTFNNPRRESWEKTAQMLELMKIQPGMTVADVGSGSGYYTFKLSRLVGDAGKVYAIEMDEDRIAYIQRVAEKLAYTNIENVRTDGMDLGLGGRKVDVALMVSLYHMIYGMSTARERNALIKDIRASLKPDGRLIIVDNAVTPPGVVPYHGPYIAKELVIAQLVNFGFKLVDVQQYIPQRYILVFQLDAAGAEGKRQQVSELAPGALPVEFAGQIQMAPVTAASPVVQASATVETAIQQATQPPQNPPLGTHLQQVLDDSAAQAFTMRVSGQTSLVHVGLGDAFTLTEEGILAGRLLLDGLENKDVNKIKEAKAVLRRIIPRENFGGEYTALEWFADYMLADETQRQAFIKDPMDAIFFHYYADEDWASLKEFLARKYHLRDLGDEYTQEGRRRKADLEHVMVFNNPRRETWEKTSKLLELMKFKPGMTVADVGSGAGYYTFKIADLLGEAGKVYAIEMEEDRIAYIQRVSEKLGYKNIENVRTDGMGLGLGGRKVDVAMMVSLYHNIYTMSTARERNALVKDIRDSLKPDGRLIIADNALVPPGAVPYHGPYIAKELVIAQLVNYGFKLIEMQQYIPQRYVLVFQRDDAPAPGKPGAPPVEFAVPVQPAPMTAAAKQ